MGSRFDAGDIKLLFPCWLLVIALILELAKDDFMLGERLVIKDARIGGVAKEGIGGQLSPVGKRNPKQNSSPENLQQDLADPPQPHNRPGSQGRG